MKLHEDVIRLISAKPSKIKEYSGRELKEAILKSEGRVLMGQTYLKNPILFPNCTSTELMFAFGADIVLLNGFDFHNPQSCQGLQGFDYQGIKDLVGGRPVGIYLGCPREDIDFNCSRFYDLKGMVCTRENLQKIKEWNVSFLILGGNPGSGTSIKDVIKWTRIAREICGDDMLIFAGKWEDGLVEKVLGDPLADYDAKETIDQLIEAGADIIDFPAPGSRHGITVERIRELIEYTHRHGALAMSFLNSNVEAADVDTIRQITLMMKQTGCDVHAIGEGGGGGGTWPENIYQMSVTLKGKAYTWAQMATPHR